MSIFVSHSSKDVELVSRVTQALVVLGQPYQAIVYEELPKEVRQGPHWWNIRNLIQNSSIVFIFLTTNVESSRHTVAWVEYEASVAASFSKPVVIFQIEGSPPEVPIPYWTAVAVINPQEPEGFLQIQAIAKAHGPVDLVNNPWARAAGGAALGSIAGPLGALIGAILAGVSAPPHPLARAPTGSCNKCGAKFHLWASPGSSFYCPHCLIAYVYGGE